MNGLVDDFDHANISEVVVGVDHVGEPGEELLRAGVLVVYVESWRRGVLGFDLAGY